MDKKDISNIEPEELVLAKKERMENPSYRWCCSVLPANTIKSERI